MATMLTVPTEAIRLAGTAAINCVLLVTVVCSGVLFHATTAPGKKPEPLTVNANPALPAMRLLGLIFEMMGVGAATATKAEFDSVPPGFSTVTVADPTLETALAGTSAVSKFPVTN